MTLVPPPLLVPPSAPGPLDVEDDPGLHGAFPGPHGAALSDEPHANANAATKSHGKRAVQRERMTISTA
jgi:hypothetical protein